MNQAMQVGIGTFTAIMFILLLEISNKHFNRLPSYLKTKEAKTK